MTKNKQKFSSKAQERRQIKTRNWLAVNAFLRSGAGRHKDQKKAANKKACRGRIRANDA